MIYPKTKVFFSYGTPCITGCYRWCCLWIWVGFLARSRRIPSPFRQPSTTGIHRRLSSRRKRLSCELALSSCTIDPLPAAQPAAATQTSIISALLQSATVILSKPCLVISRSLPCRTPKLSRAGCQHWACPAVRSRLLSCSSLAKPQVSLRTC